MKKVRLQRGLILLVLMAIIFGLFNIYIVNVETVKSFYENIVLINIQNIKINVYNLTYTLIIFALMLSIGNFAYSGLEYLESKTNKKDL